MLRLSPVRRTVEILRQRAQTGTDERAANLQSSHAPPAVLRLRAIHRELGGLFFPYKRYEAEVIFGVLEGLITCETLGFEDYPCEMTMLRWLSQKAQLLLWRNP